MAEDVALDLNGINRMPITAMHIGSEQERKKLSRNQWISFILDGLIFISNLLFMYIAPIEKDKASWLNPKTNTDVLCKSTRWFKWSIGSLFVAIASCVLDLLTIRQIRKNYVNAFTALMGFIVDCL